MYTGFLDCKEIKPVNPKGNQAWIFIGRTDAEVETPILLSPDAENWLTGKDPDAGKDWSWEEKGMDRGWDGWMASPTRWTWVWASPGRWWRTRKSDVLQSMGLQKVGHNWMTEQLQRLANSQVHRNFFVKYHRFCFTWKWQTWLNYILWKIFL